jgi:AbrB family looped-hinge helix DNA binding protein
MRDKFYSTSSGFFPSVWRNFQIYLLTFLPYFPHMKATLTSKGQITIPADIRQRLHLKPGDVLEFDESVPFLKATKAISPKAWAAFGQGWKDPWPGQGMEQVMEDLRGEVALPPRP